MTNENELNDEFEKWFSMEYGTPVSVLVNCRTEDGYTVRTSTNIYYSWQAWQASSQSKQSRIDLLESAIREFLKSDLRCELSSFNHEPCEAENELRYIARTNLEKLLENEK